MSNYELYEHKRSDTVKWVLTLIAFIVVGIMLAGIILGWFEKDDAEEEQAGVPAYSFIVGNGEGTRMSLTSVRNSAVTGESVTITATVEPDNEAENTGVDWTATWKNAGSVWASGKSVSDYVTLTPGGEDYAASKSVTLENLQPFAEQIVVKATARDDLEITATCTADYAQKPVNFTLSFGEVSCNFGGDTDITLEINANAASAPGGAADAQFTKSEVYSLSQEFTVSYELTGKKFMSYTASGCKRTRCRVLRRCYADISEKRDRKSCDGIAFVCLYSDGIAALRLFADKFADRRHRRRWQCNFKTFYVEHEGKQILAQKSELALEPGKTYRFDVKYTFDTGQTEARDYSVEIVPNAEQDFEYTVDGETYLYSKAGDLSAAFSLKKQKSYFEITLREDMTIQSVLETIHPGQQVEVPENASDGNPFPYVLIVSSYNGNVSYRIAFDLGADVTGITLDPSQIIFTG